MHRVIKAIVYATSEEEALEEAKDIFDRLVDAGKFDYYTTFDMDGNGVSGSDRWGDLPTVARADSEEGRKLINRAMRKMKDEFEDNIEKIRKMVNECDNETLFEEGRNLDDSDPKVVSKKLKDEELSDLHMFRHY